MTQRNITNCSHCLSGEGAALHCTATFVTILSTWIRQLNLLQSIVWYCYFGQKMSWNRVCNLVWLLVGGQSRRLVTCNPGQLRTRGRGGDLIISRLWATAQPPAAGGRRVWSAHQELTSVHLNLDPATRTLDAERSLSTEYTPTKATQAWKIIMFYFHK